MVDDADLGEESETQASTSGASAIGDTARVIVALSGVVLGIVWTVRVAMESSLASGVLFRLLPPLVLIYLGLRYFRSVVTTDPDDSE